MFQVNFQKYTFCLEILDKLIGCFLDDLDGKETWFALQSEVCYKGSVNGAVSIACSLIEPGKPPLQTYNYEYSRSYSCWLVINWVKGYIHCRSSSELSFWDTLYGCGAACHCRVRVSQHRHHHHQLCSLMSTQLWRTLELTSVVETSMSFFFNVTLFCWIVGRH